MRSEVTTVYADQDAFAATYLTYQDPELDVGYRNLGGTIYEFRTATRFPLPAALVPELIQSATLKLYYFAAWGSSASRSVRAHRVLQSWSETGVFFGAPVDSSFTEATVGGTNFRWISWDVTAAARLWAANPSSNFGIMLLADPVGSGDNAFRFYSRESANTSYLPVLEITHQNPTMLSVTMVPNITINGDPGNYTLQYASGLGGGQINWVTLANISMTGTTTNWLDYSSVGQSQRLYRATTSNPNSEMALIPAGSFSMGDTFSEGDHDELPLHTVYVSAFSLGRTEVTAALWDEVKGWSGGNGYGFDLTGLRKAANHPVYAVSWYDAVKWCNARSEKEGRTPAYYTDAALTQVYKTGQMTPYVKWNAGYRLPTEAEWEKAARGGASGHRFPWSNVETITHSQANYWSDSSSAYDVSPTRGYHPVFDVGGEPYTSPVGSFAANGYGLYDMAGNVGEWCWDWYGAYSSDSQTDPRGPTTGSNRVIRGGYWFGYAGFCRVADRLTGYPTSGFNFLGFRVVLPPGQ